MRERLLIFASRAVNMLTGGSPHELLCTRAHRNNWRWFIKLIDAEFIRRGHKPNHCASCARWDRRYNGRPE